MSSRAKKYRIRISNELYGFLKDKSKKLYFPVGTLLQMILLQELSDRKSFIMHPSSYAFTPKQGEKSLGGGVHQISMNLTNEVFVLWNNAAIRLAEEKGYTMEEYASNDLMNEYNVALSKFRRIIVTSCILNYKEKDK